MYAGVRKGQHKKPQTLKSDRAQIVLCACTVVLTLARVALAALTPMVPNMRLGVDDGLMIRQAQNLLETGWLGVYDNLTLVKNPGFPMLLALFYKLHISFQVGFICLYCMSCACACQAIRPLVPSFKIRTLLYTVLLYVPVLFSYALFQRVYRNGIEMPFALFLFSGLIALYLRSDEKKSRVLPWVLLACVGMVYIVLGKENGIWPIPFVAVCVLVTVVKWVRAWSKGIFDVPAMLYRVVACALACLAVCGVGVFVARANAKAYGVQVLNDKYESSFADASSLIMSIGQGTSTDEDVWISRETLEVAFQTSPSLMRYRDYYVKAWDKWAGAGGELQGDISYWALRDGYLQAGGYVSGAETNRYWSDVAAELQQAFRNATLRKREGISISKTTLPIPEGGLSQVVIDAIRTMGSLVKMTAMKTTVIRSAGNAQYGDGSYDVQRTAKEILGGNALLGTEADGEGRLDADGELWVQANGWVLDVSHLLGRGLTMVYVVISVGCALGAIVLAIHDVRCRNVDGVKSGLIVLGLVLEAFVLVFGVSWAMRSASIQTPESHVRALFSYCSSFYVMSMLVECVVLGRLLELTKERGQA